MNYQQYIQRLSVKLGLMATDFNFEIAIPEIIQAAEQRIYRELNLLAAVSRNSTALATANTRNFTLPIPAAGPFVVVNQVNVVTPVGSTVSTGSVNPLTPVSIDYLQMSWPSNTSPSATTIPQFFAMITDQTLMFGPAPGDTFNVEVIGEIRPNPLSAANPTTYLSLYLPDLFITASMVQYGMYGNQAGLNAAQVNAWEQMYQAQKGSADEEENRKRFAGASWTSQALSPIAQPQRG